MRRGIVFIRAVFRRFLSAAACSPDVRSRTPAGSSANQFLGVHYGRLHRIAGLFSFYLGFGSLIFVGLCFPLPSFADTRLQASDKAMSSCRHLAISQFPAIEGVADRCALVFGPADPVYPAPGASPLTVVGWFVAGGSPYSTLPFPFDPPSSDPCSGVPTVRIYNSGKLLQGYSICQSVPDPDSGGTVQCAMTFSPISPPTVNKYSGGWETYGSLSSSGALCGSDDDGGWHDVHGGTPAPAPPPPNPLPAPDVPDPPQICGGKSCYDPGKDQYCATSGGVQTCVPGGPGRSAGGACAIGADIAVCSGSPVPPAPPPPPSSPISNPGLERRGGGDTTTHADPNTGSNTTTTTVVYGTTGSTVSSGQQSGDVGPSGSGGGGTGDPGDGDGTCTAGALCNDQYIDAPCGSDPLTAGDPVLGAIAKDMHRVRCKQGDGMQASDFDGQDTSMGDDHPASDFVKDGDDGGSNPLGKLDSSGFLAHGSCPGLPTVEFLGHDILSGASSAICRSAGMLGSYILAMAYAFAALIMARVKSGG